MLSRRHILCGAAVAAAAGTITTRASAQPAEQATAPTAAVGRRNVVIGTGRVTGIYYPVGGALCRVVNRARDQHLLRCLVEPTEGSIANLKALRGGEVDLALVQSDWQAAALSGTGPFSGNGGFPELRAVASLHADSVTVLARADQPIQSFADLKGRNVNLGPAGSSLRQMVDRVVAAHGMTAKSFKSAGDLAPDRQVEALCAGQIDAAIFVVGHPNGAVRETLAACGARPIPLEEEAVAKLTAEDPAIVATTIPASFYSGVEADVPTVGVVATLVATTAFQEDAAYELARALITGIDELRAEHPALQAVEPVRMVGTGHAAPLHPGAERYYQEAGLLE